MKAEPVDAIFAGQFDLAAHGFGTGQIIEPDVVRNMGLVVTDEMGHRLCDVRPLSEAFPVPKIVFRNGMKLRQVKRDDFGTVCPGNIIGVRLCDENIRPGPIHFEHILSIDLVTASATQALPNDKELIRVFRAFFSYTVFFRRLQRTPIPKKF